MAVPIRELQSERQLQGESVCCGAEFLPGTASTSVIRCTLLVVLGTIALDESFIERRLNGENLP